MTAVKLHYMAKSTGPSIHPFIYFLATYLGPGCKGSSPSSPSHHLQFCQRDIKVFPSQLNDIISPVCAGSTLGNIPKTLTSEASGGHPSEAPKPPHLAFFLSDSTQCLSWLSNWVSHCISEQSHFHHLYHVHSVPIHSFEARHVHL